MTVPAADGRGGSQPPRPAPAGGGPGQWFVLGPWLFDIPAATAILRREPRPARPLPVTEWARAYGLIPGPGGSPDAVPLIGPGPGFDPGYAMTTDLTEPVIVATIPVPGGPPALLLIDGYALPVTVRNWDHRPWSVIVGGRKSLPAGDDAPGVAATECQ